MGKPEGIVEDYLIAQCKKHKFWCKKFVSPGETGVPDRIVIANGCTMFIELKSKNGRLSEKQKIIIDEIKNAGGKAYVAYTKEQIDTILNKYTAKDINSLIPTGKPE